MEGERHAVLIGASTFPSEPELQDLACPDNDVDELAAILQDAERGGFVNLIALKNEPSHLVLRKINQTLRRVHKEDLVLIYYSGHGKLDPAGRLHLATVDTEIEVLESTSVPVQTIRNFIDVSSSTKTALILDCCYSGAVDKAFLRGSVDDQLNIMSSGRGTFIITASTSLQTAREKEAEGHGIFTKHFIEGIREGHADRDGDGLVTMSELYRYVHGQVLTESHQEPMKWDLNVRGEMVIAKSGRMPREERRAALRQRLFDLGNQNLISDALIARGLEVIGKPVGEMSEVELHYDATLNMLLEPDLRLGDFFEAWHGVVPPEPQQAAPPPSAPTGTEDYGKVEARGAGGMAEAPAAELKPPPEPETIARPGPPPAGGFLNTTGAAFVWIGGGLVFIVLCTAFFEENNIRWFGLNDVESGLFVATLLLLVSFARVWRKRWSRLRRLAKAIYVLGAAGAAWLNMIALTGAL